MFIVLIIVSILTAGYALRGVLRAALSVTSARSLYSVADPTGMILYRITSRW
jgi:hypothetical protein